MGRKTSIVIFISAHYFRGTRAYCVLNRLLLQTLPTGGGHLFLWQAMFGRLDDVLILGASV